MKKILFIFLLFPFFAFASDKQILFKCTTNNGKIVKVQSIGNNIQYSFGSSARNELVFKNSKETVSIQTKNTPSPSYRTQWLILKNGNYFYIPSVSNSQPDENGNIETEGSITVVKKFSTT